MNNNNIDEPRRLLLKSLSERMGVEFFDLSLLNEALTHASFANESKQSIKNSERMEFLGDAVLELAASTYLFNHFPLLPEGELTRIRAGIVCSNTLARLADRLGLGGCLLLGHGEEQGGGRSRTSNLEDAFEAVIGAVYIDQGWETAEAYVLRQLEGEFKAVGAGERLRDYKTLLQELVQKDADGRIDYELLREFGPDHQKTFDFAVKVNGKVMGHGRGHSKKEAAQRAAREALAKLSGI